MKKMLKDLQTKAETVLQKELATKDRPFGFRILVVLLLVINIFLIAFSIIKIIA